MRIAKHRRKREKMLFFGRSGIIRCGVWKGAGVMVEVANREKKQSKPMRSDLDESLPAWVADRSTGRTTPFSEAKLDLFVESTLESIRDTASWSNLVHRVGEEEARRVLRARIIMRDENANKLPRH